jgi:hypothetical protein
MPSQRALTQDGSLVSLNGWILSFGIRLDRADLILKLNHSHESKYFPGHRGKRYRTKKERMLTEKEEPHFRDGGKAGKELAVALGLIS